MAVIQWYPGHMNKARNQIEDKLGLIDVVVEVLDARIPLASRNPLIQKLVGQKPHLIILNKADLADPVMTRQWQEVLAGETHLVVSLDSLHHTNMNGLLNSIKKAASVRIKKLEAKGAVNPTIRTVIVGVPNCGKSTLINRLVGHHAAEVGNKPGVTKGQKWLKTQTNIQILDTPGILWPKFTAETVGYKLAALGAIKDSIFHSDDVALYVLDALKRDYRANLMQFARVSAAEFEQLSNPDLLLAMTKKYGMQDDYDRFSLYFLQRLRKGKLGRISLDRP